MKLARLFFGVLLCAGLSCSPDHGFRVSSQATLPLAALTNAIPSAGAFLVSPLKGAAVEQQSNLLVRLRGWPKQAGFEAREFKEPREPKHSIRYLLFKPNTNTAGLPLVLSLHGGGPRRRFEDLLEPHAPGFAYGLGRLTAPETQSAHPSFVLAPWSNDRGWDEDHLRVILHLLDALQQEFKIDPARIYVTGQSMGGFGTWAIAALASQRFAAAIPICGGGDPSTARDLMRMPIWAFHGSADGVVPASYTRNMIQALQEIGAKPIYWEYEGATHADTAERAYCEPGLMNWLFAQRRP